MSDTGDPRDAKVRADLEQQAAAQRAAWPHREPVRFSSKSNDYVGPPSDPTTPFPILRPFEHGYRCLHCTWAGIMAFNPADPVDADELEKIGNILSDYPGPCTRCGYFTLVPVDAFEVDDAILRDELSFGQPSRYGGYQYVGEPEIGHDIPGVWSCHFADTRSGYAHVGHAVAWALQDDLQLSHQLVPHRMRGIDIDRVPRDRQEATRRFMANRVGIGRALIVTLPPMGAAQMNGYGKTKVVCYGTHECDRVSPNCAEVCNPGPDAGGFTRVWVKSAFALRSFVAGGVRAERLRLVDPPLIGGPWTIPLPSDRERARRERLRILGRVDEPGGTIVGARGSTFRFGMLGTWIARKGFEDLLRAYYGTFRRSDDVVLELRTSPLLEHETPAAMEEHLTKVAQRIRQEVGVSHEHRARVLFHVGTDKTDQEVIDWVTGLDAFANSSYGEGLGIPQLYAMAAGVPLVTTAFGATGEIAETFPQSHVIVPHTLERIGRDMLQVSRMYDPGQKYGRYDPKAFGEGMAELFERGVDGCHTTDDAAVAPIRDHYSFRAGAERLHAAIVDLGIDPETVR